MDYAYELVGALTWRMLIGKKLHDDVDRSVTVRFSSLFLPPGCLDVQSTRSFLSAAVGDLFDINHAQSLRFLPGCSTDLFHRQESNMVRAREEHLCLQYGCEFRVESPTGIR